MLLLAFFVFLQQSTAKTGEPNQYGQYPIHLAVGAGDKDKVKRLIAEGADVNQRQYRERRPDEGWPPLFLALNNPEIMSLLIDAGADINASVPRETTITLAAKSGKDEAVELLLSHKAKINEGNRSPALLGAIRLGHLGIALALVEHGAKFHQPAIGERKPWEIANYSQDAFSSAAGTGDLQLVGSMLDKGANPYHAGAWCVAASKGQLKVLQILATESQINNRANLGVLDLALASAVVARKQKVADFLLKAGASRSAYKEGQKEALRRAV